MSILRIQAVWTHSKSAGNDRLLLIALADASNDEGYSFPGIGSLVTKVNAARETVLSCIKRLEDSGEIYVDRRRRRGNRYLVASGMSDEARIAALRQFFELDADEAHAVVMAMRNKSNHQTKSKRGNKSNLQTKHKSNHQTNGESRISLIDPSNKSNHQTGSVNNHRSKQQDSDHERKASPPESGGGGNLDPETKRRVRQRADDPDMATVCKAYEGNIGLLTERIGRQLSKALDEYPTDWITEAIEIAVDRNKRRWSYARAILERWSSDGKDSPKAANGSAPPRPAVHFPKPRRDCDTCGGTGMQLGPKNESLPCPACLEAERNAKEVTHEQG